MKLANPVILGIVVILFAAGLSFSADTTQNFSGSGTPYTLTNYGSGADSSVSGGRLQLTTGSTNNNVIAFSQTAAGTYGKITAEWDMTINDFDEGGFGFALLDTATFAASGPGPDLDWEEPSLDNCLTVAFDPYDYYAAAVAANQQMPSEPRQPQVSVHFNGIERQNLHCTYDFRDSTFHVTIVIEAVTGGSEITFTVGGVTVYDKYFVAEMHPYDCRAAFGGQDTTSTIDNISITYENPLTAPPESPVVHKPFDNYHMPWGSAPRMVDYVFPDEGKVYEKVLMKLRIGNPPNWVPGTEENDRDKWDRFGSISVLDANDNAFEICRFITPYVVYTDDGSWTWYSDATDFQTFFKGETTFELDLTSWEGNGFGVTLELDFLEGSPEYIPSRVTPLWNGSPTYAPAGEVPMAAFFTEKNITISEDTVKASVRITTTGHWGDNNEAEFNTSGRTLQINDTNDFYNVLWKDDVCLNPCRPQGGTWYWNRAGWAPGEIVEPWRTDVTSLITPGANLKIEYLADTHRDTYPGQPDYSYGQHITHSYLVEYTLNSETPEIPYNMQGLSILAANWMDVNCGQCQGADMSDDGNVGLDDLEILAQNWLSDQ